MAETSTQFKWFSIPQYKEEQEYLRSMHRSGWKLISVTFPGFYHFERCTPEDVVYQLDFNQNGINNKQEYVQMFQDCEWEYLFDFVGYSYFRKPVSKMNGPEEIFSDDESRLDMMKRVFKGRVRPLLIIFCGIILPQFFLQTSLSGRSYGNKVLAITYLVLFFAYLQLFISFGVQFFAYEKKIREPDSKNKLKYGALLIVTIAMGVLVIIGAVNIFKPMKSKYFINTFNHQYSITAEYLDKTVKQDIELKDGDLLDVNLCVQEGYVKVLIYLDESDPIYKGTVSDMTSFTLPISKDGTYTIVTTGKKAEGNLSFTKR